MGVLIPWCSDRTALATMGNGLLIRTAQIKTRQWSSFLLSFPSFSLHFPPSSACLPVCVACVISPLVPLSPTLFHKEAERMFACIRESLRISLSFLPVPALLLSLLPFPNFLCQSLTSSVLLKRYILGVSNLKDAQKLTSIGSASRSIVHTM